jgi:hypothetical protein
MNFLTWTLAALMSIVSVASASAAEAMYLDTALADGWAIKGQTSVIYHRDVDGKSSEFSRVEVIVQKGKLFALCAIDTDLVKSTAPERPCFTFK